MPSKGRWALNPRKWFGVLAQANQKREKKPLVSNPLHPSIPSTPLMPVTRMIPATPFVSRVNQSKTKVKNPPSPPSPVMISRTSNNRASPVTIHRTNNRASPIVESTPVVPFQLPSFPMRRDPSMTYLTTSKIAHRPNSFALIPTEPSIRKSSHIEQDLTLDNTTNRLFTPVRIGSSGPFFTSPSVSVSQQCLTREDLNVSEQLDFNLSSLSNQCLIDYPRPPSNNLMEKHSISSSSSIEDVDDGEESSSSGVYTDERADADLHDDHRTASKDTLSTLEVLSIESIIDSQSSFEHCSTRPKIHHYRLPINPEPIRKSSAPVQRQRAHSAEGILKISRPVQTPTIPKSRQSSAAIARKIDKRVPTSRSPSATLEKAGFKRVANDTYRLVNEKAPHLYRQNRPNSIIISSDLDDSLPAANDEERYADVPRASSTEQLHIDIQQNLQAIVEDCIRPIINGTNSFNTTKSQSRSKRSHGHKSTIRIDEITNRLRSSIDYSTYTQYQRCYS